MKFPRSVLIYLFLMTILTAFNWAMIKTNGNILKSLQFTGVVIAFKMGLIRTENILESNQSNSNRQVGSSLTQLESPGYHPYLSLENDYRPSGLFMDSIERSSVVSQYSYSQNAIKNLRAGDRISEAAWLVITILMLRLQEHGVGFQPAKQVARPPHIEAAQNLLFGKPKSDGQSRLHLSNSNQFSPDEIPTQIQAANFVKNGKVDLPLAYLEVNRRASVIGNENFDCSFQRFKDLATECGTSKPSTVREAITILEGEMHGYYKNARRVYYGPDVKGPDFAVEGLGKFAHITHTDAKGGVGSSIQPTPSINKKAKKYVARINYQKDFWPNGTAVKEKIPHIRPDAYLPKFRDNFLAVYDLWDVQTSEKSEMSNAIIAYSGNDSNFIILNKHTNT